MPRDPNVLYREYNDFAIWVWLVLFGATAIGLWAALNDPGAGLVAASIVASIPVFFWLIFGRLRVDVTREALELQFGRLGIIKKTVDFEQIEDLEAVTYRPLLDFGGWGIRWGSRGKKAWTTRGNQAVRISMAGGGSLFVGSQHPQRLLQRIRTAMSRADT